MKEIELELTTSIDMLETVEKGIKGGIFIDIQKQIINIRKTSNDKELLYLAYWDAINLHWMKCLMKIAVKGIYLN